ncbi:hypothetical protein F5Y06DRAFT_303382 [Hypoxylon sp. FL0890]|nr:hypothetical protein F5Y06DRAFT_303382 [Hypoxylon sp. FL0890]
MPPKASPKAAADAAKPAKGWSAEESASLLLIIMQEDNPQLAVKGWRSIGEKAKVVFGDKFSAASMKHQFQKLRRTYLDELSAVKGVQDNQVAAVQPSFKRKRAAADDGDAIESKRVRFSMQQAKAKNDYAADNTTDAPQKLPQLRTTTEVLQSGKSDTVPSEHTGAVDEEV